MTDLDVRQLYEFVRIAEEGKREQRVWNDCSRHYAERRGYYAVNKRTMPYALAVNPLLLGGYITENIPQTVNIAHARMCRQRYMPEAVVSASFSSMEDLFAAEASNQFLRDHWTRNQSQRRRDWVARNILIGGDDFIGLRYDPEQMGTVTITANDLMAYEQMTGNKPVSVVQIGENENREPLLRVQIPVGGTVEYRVEQDLVFVEDGPTEWSEVTRFCIVSYPSAYAAQMQWTYSPGADKIRAMNIQDLKGAGTSYLFGYQDYSRYNTQTDPITANQYRDRTCIAEFWIKEPNGWRRNVRTGYGFRDEVDDSSGYPINPFIHYRFTKTGDFWSQGLVQGMVTPGFSLNVAMTQMKQYLAGAAKTVWMVPMGSKMEILSNEFNTIMRYDSTGAAPVVKTADPSILQMFQAMIEMDMNFVTIGGQLGDIGMGDTPSRISGRVFSSTQSAVYGQLDLAASNVRESDAECARKILVINQSMASDWPRMAKLFGGNGTSLIRSFKGSDILGGQDISVTTTDMSSEARAQRAQEALELLPFGFFDPMPGSDERTKRFLGYVDGKTIKDLEPAIVRLSEVEANNEYQLMLNGRVGALATGVLFNMDGAQIKEAQLNPTYLGYVDDSGMPEPLLKDEQDHAIHIEQHRLQSLDPSTPKRVRQMLVYHIKAEHEPRLNYQRMAAQAQQAQLAKQMSLADATGQIATAVAQGEIQKEVVQVGAKAKAASGDSSQSRGVRAQATPAAGGRRSGATRSR
jgi:hypothetical protein